MPDAKLQIYQTWIALALAIALSALSLHFAYSVSDIVMDPTDTAYYIISYIYAKDITFQSTFFGVIWYSLFGQVSVQLSRLLFMAAAFISGALFAISLIRFLGDQPNIKRVITVSLMSGVAFLSYFNWLLLDPSYNGMILIACVLGFVAFVAILKRVFLSQPPGRPPYGLCALFGLAMFVAALIKATSVVVVGGGMAVVFFASAGFDIWTSGLRHSRLRPAALAGMVAAFMGGILVCLGWLWITFASPADLLARFQGGVMVATDVMRILFSPGEDLARLAAWSVYAGQSLGQNGYLSVVWALALAALFLLRDRLARLSLGWLAGIGALFALLTLAWIFLSWPRWTAAQMPANRESLTEIYLTATAVAVAGLAASARQLGFVRSLAILLGLLLPVMVVPGTGNKLWVYNVIMGLGVPVAIALVFLSRLRLGPFDVGAVASIALLVAVIVSSVARMEYNGYLFYGRLSEATVKVDIGPPYGTLRAPPKLAATYLPLVAHQYTGPLSDAPVLIDLTGRTPVANILLRMEVPGMAWLLAGHPWSNDLLDFYLSRLSAEDLERAHVLVPIPDAEGETEPDGRQDVFDRQLERTGRIFPDDYVRLTETPLPNGKKAELYAPTGAAP